MKKKIHPNYHKIKVVMTDDGQWADGHKCGWASHDCT